MNAFHRIPGFLPALALLPVSAGAHHSVAAEFDTSRFVEIECEITGVEWVNPHIRMTIRDSDGQVWQAEGIGRTYMRQRGIELERLPIGEPVTIAGHLSRDGGREIFATNMLLDGGEELVLAGGARPRWSGRHEDDGRSLDSER